MNKREVIERVSELSGVDREISEKVLKALQKVLQDELGKSGGFGAMGKIMELMKLLKSGDISE